MASSFFVGCYTNEKKEGILLGELDEESGKIRLARTVGSNCINASFVASHVVSSRKIVYCVNETCTSDAEPNGYVTAFYEADSGDLTQLGSPVSSGGVDPCHLSLSSNHSHLFVANYTSGTIAALPLAVGGSLQEASDVVTLSVPEQDSSRASHAHFITVTPDRQFVLVADLGLDSVFVFHFDEITGKFAQHARCALPSGSGPRHIAFHPSLAYVFVLCELRPCVAVLRYHANTDTETDRADTRSVLDVACLASTEQIGSQKDNAGSHIAVSRCGRFVYCGNRGHSCIDVLRFTSEPEKLSLVQSKETCGVWPRHFALSSSGKMIVVANQRSNNVTAFHMDTESGHIGAQTGAFECHGPVCVLFRE